MKKKESQKRKPGGQPIGDKPLVKKLIGFDEESLKRGRNIGRGNLSLGVRTAIKRYKEEDS